MVSHVTKYHSVRSRKPFVTSGIRLGTPAATTRGFDEKALRKLQNHQFSIKNSKDEEKLQQAKERVAKLTAEYPLYQ